MKKLAVVVLIIAAAAAVYWLAAPLFIDKEVSETAKDVEDLVPSETGQILVAEGKFAGEDNFHKGEGMAKLVKVGEKYFVRLEDDFRVTNGPDLFVHFGRDGKYSSEARIGALKGNVGGQNYEVPAGINPEDYNEVWIWCRAFSVPFASAVLNRK